MLGSSLMIACTYAFPTAMELIIVPHGYDSVNASLYGVLYNLFGIIGGIIVVIILS